MIYCKQAFNLIKVVILYNAEVLILLARRVNISMGVCEVHVTRQAS